MGRRMVGGSYASTASAHQLCLLCGNSESRKPARRSRRGRNLDHNMLRQQLPLVLREDGGPFDHVTQFAHVAWPAMLQQLEAGFRAQRQPVRTKAVEKTDGQGGKSSMRSLSSGNSIGKIASR